MSGVCCHQRGIPAGALRLVKKLLSGEDVEHTWLPYESDRWLLLLAWYSLTQLVATLQGLQLSLATWEPFSWDVRDEIRKVLQVKQVLCSASDRWPFSSVVAQHHLLGAAVLFSVQRALLPRFLLEVRRFNHDSRRLRPCMWRFKAKPNNKVEETLLFVPSNPGL